MSAYFRTIFIFASLSCLFLDIIADFSIYINVENQYFDFAVNYIADVF